MAKGLARLRAGVGRAKAIYREKVAGPRRATKRKVWLEQLKRARLRFNDALSHRSLIADVTISNIAHLRKGVAYGSGGRALYMGEPVDLYQMHRASTERILWLKDWLDYGRAIGEVEGFYRDGNLVEEYPPED